MKVLDLFSGIGGFSLAADSLSIPTVAFCEREDYPKRVLARHWPDVPCFEDVMTLDGDTIRGLVADTEGGRREQLDTRERGVPVAREDGSLIITAGFPCQDISYAGRGEGLEGERSGLFFEIIRLIGELGPDYVLLENVSALLTRGLDAVLGALAEVGYDAEWACVPACAVGAPHRRDRIWVVAYPQGTHERPAFVEYVTNHLTPFGADHWHTPRAIYGDHPGMTCETHLTGQAAQVWPTPAAQVGARNITSGRNNPNSEHHGGTTLDDAMWLENDGEKPSGSLNPDWVETLMGYSIGYTRPDGEQMREMAGMWPAGLGAPQHEWEPPRLTTKRENRAARLKALGNSIVPQVAQLWLEAIQSA